MRRPDLTPDCRRCTALCCVATCFDASADFAFSKAAGEPCRHLTRDHACAIHAQLVERGCPGCAAFDCYGAGQRVTRLFPPAEREAAFHAYRELHELLWLTTEAAKLCPALAAELEAEAATLDALVPTEESLAKARRRVHALLVRVRVSGCSENLSRRSPSHR